MTETEADLPWPSSFALIINYFTGDCTEKGYSLYRGGEGRGWHTYTGKAIHWLTEIIL